MYFFPFHSEKNDTFINSNPYALCLWPKGSVKEVVLVFSPFRLHLLFQNCWSWNKDVLCMFVFVMVQCFCKKKIKAVNVFHNLSEFFLLSSLGEEHEPLFEWKLNVFNQSFMPCLFEIGLRCGFRRGRIRRALLLKRERERERERETERQRERERVCSIKMVRLPLR